jgi:hypothetical protein
VFLEDAFTGRNVKDAKVTLEGFEIPAIVGEYDKKGKFYYFTEIPVGYNTVMAYHKKYNEKGFQDKKGLPKEIKLQLYDPMNVAFEFPYPLEDDISQFTFTNDYFIEDPYKIAIKIGSVNNCKCVDSIIETLSLDIEIIDIEKRFNKKILGINKFSCDSSYVYGDDDSRGEVINVGGHKLKPLIFRSSDKNCEIHGGSILFLRKKDGTKFKRFNDPTIKKLRMNNLFVNVITYHRFAYYATKPYKSKFATKDKTVRKNDRNFFAVSETKKSEALFYGDYFTLKTIRENSPIRYIDKIILEFETLQYDDLGLGIFDQYDYFIKLNGKTFDYNF